MSTIHATSSARIDVPIDRVFAFLSDADRAMEWQSGLVRFEIHERDADGRALVATFESDAKVRTVKSVVRMRYEEPHGLSWKQERGDLRAASGHWLLEDLDGRATQATYALEVELGRLLATVIRGPLVGLLRDKMAGARPGELKRAVEAAVGTTA
jgi:hypothetical protein